LRQAYARENVDAFEKNAMSPEDDQTKIWLTEVENKLAAMTSADTRPVSATIKVLA
jgi:hypothetical protein